MTAVRILIPKHLEDPAILPKQEADRVFNDAFGPVVHNVVATALIAMGDQVNIAKGGRGAAAVAPDEDTIEADLADALERTRFFVTQDGSNKRRRISKKKKKFILFKESTFRLLAWLLRGSRQDSFCAPVKKKYVKNDECPINFMVLIYQSGCVVFVGVPTPDAIELAAAFFQYDLQTRVRLSPGNDNPLFLLTNLQIVNMQGTFYMNYKLYQSKIERFLGRVCYHEQNIKPVQYSANGIMVLIYQDGRCVVMGTPDPRKFTQHVTEMKAFLAHFVDLHAPVAMREEEEELD